MQWGFPALSRKAHVFVSATSLCGKWMFRPHDGEPAITALPEKGPDDCADCYRRLARHFDKLREEQS